MDSNNNISNSGMDGKIEYNGALTDDSLRDFYKSLKRAEDDAKLVRDGKARIERVALFSPSGLAAYKQGKPAVPVQYFTKVVKL